MKNQKFINWYYRMLKEGFSMSRIAQIVYTGDEKEYVHI
jgi:hypothetical protein